MTGTTSPHVPVRPQWLAATREEVLEPERRIVDPHHHLWERPESPYLPPDLLADLAAGHRVVATVLVEAHYRYREDGDPLLRPVGEIEFAAAAGRAAATDPTAPAICAGIVGAADLTAGARVPDILDACIEAGDGRFRGVRSSSVSHPDRAARGSMLNFEPGMLARPDFREGFAHLPARGLTFDAWMYHTQLDDLVGLASAFPDAMIILNHVGGPIGIGPYAGRRDEVFGAWRSAIERVARCENVVVKLGGFGMRLFGFGFHAADAPPGSDAIADAVRPYVETCIDLFGPARCMFESNFPVDKGSFSYVSLWNAFKKIVLSHPEHDKDLLFRGTAARTYRLGLD